MSNDAATTPALATPARAMRAELPEWALSEIEAKMAKMARRAKRLGFEEPSVRVVSRFKRENRRLGVSFPWVVVEATGCRPVVADWAVIGAVVHVTREDAVLNAAPGEEVPEKYRHTGNKCEHCGTNRRRKETIILRHKDGRTMQIGRNCAADFLGDAELAGDLVARWRELQKLTDLFAGNYDEDGPGFGGGAYTPSVLGFLTMCAHVVRMRGFAKSGHGETSTVSLAYKALNGGFFPKELKALGLSSPTDEDRETAEAALAWVAGLPEAERASGYMANLYAACKALTAAPKLRGLLASLVGAAYPRAMRAKAEAEREAERAKNSPSQYVGEVRGRIEFTAEIVRLRGWEGMYGFTTLFVLRDSDGNDLVWYASGRLIEHYSEGDIVTGKGTVKRHQPNKRTGVPETVLTRCRLTKQDKAAA